MSHIQFVLELGTDYVDFFRPTIATTKAASLFTVRGTAVAAQLLSPHGFAFTQAPFNTKRLRLAPANYAEILVASVYADQSALFGLVRAGSA